MATLIVTGMVKRIFFDGKGVAISEPYTAKGDVTKHREYTAWFHKAPNIEIGDTIVVEGRHGAVIEAWTNQDGSAKLDHTGKQGQSVRVSINDAEITQVLEGRTTPPIKFDDNEMPF